MPRRRRSSTISALLRSANSRGGTPCLSASYVIGVPCSSVPLAMSTRDPRSRSKRARTSAGTANPATWPMWRGPLAYGHAGATRTVLFLSATDHKGNLATDRVGQSRQHLGRGAPEQLLVELCQLAPEREVAGGHHVRDDRQRFPDPVGRVEDDRWPGVAVERRQQSAEVARLARQVAEEREARPAVSRGGQRGGDRAGTRNRNHGVACRPGGGHQRLSWIGERGRPRVADESDVVLLELRHDPGQPATLHRCAVADEWPAYTVPGEQPRGDAGVFSSNRAHLTENSERARADVFEISDRGRDDEQPAHAWSSQSPTLSAISAGGPIKREAGGRTSRNALP